MLASLEKFYPGTDSVDMVVFFSDSAFPSLRTAGRREGRHLLALVHRDDSPESLQTPLASHKSGEGPEHLQIAISEA